MKKSLLAVAAMGAFAGAAQAQSSVTVYGILDVGYIGSNAKERGAWTQKSAFGQSAETTNRLGFRGTEDLGGGMNAFFTVELGLTPQNANLSGGTAADAIQKTTQSSGSAIDNRQAFVGVNKKGLGQFAFGRQYTPVFVAGSQTSPGQYNNVIGDLVYAGAASVWASSSTTNTGNNNGIGFTNRASNALTVQTDRFGGLVLSGMYAMNNQDRTQSATIGTGQTDWNAWGLGANFVMQKLTVTAAYQSFNTNYATGVTTTGADYAFGGTGATSSVEIATTAQSLAAGPVRDNQMLAGAVYDFGIMKAYAQYGNRAVNTSGSESLNRTAYQLGARGNITKTVEAWASAGMGSVKADAGGTTANFYGYQVGSNYILSKRTNLYGIVGYVQTDSTSGYANSNGGGAQATQYALGVRHTF